MGSKAIEVRGLTKKFGELLAVNDVSFHVEVGEIFGFLGPNGAGKTTTINILTTIMKPTSGEAYVMGHNVTEEPIKVRERIGVVFQDNTVDRNLTGWENLYIHGLIYGLGGEDLREKIEESLEFAELTRFKDVPVKNYSGGMVRRLEIARALMHRPDVLFLDEPTIGLDPQTRAKIWEYIRRLREEGGVTIFMTTHYMDEAEKLCDRVAIIDHGRIVAIGSPDELKGSLGGDILYVKIANGHAAIEGFAEEVIRSGTALSYKVVDGTIALKVNQASKSIPQVFRMADGLGVTIEEIKYVQPSLADVFLHYTGRELRDEEGSWKDSVRVRIMARRR